MKVVLASASPARLATLRSAGIHPQVVVSGIDETQFAAPASTELALLLAVAKARAVTALRPVAEAELVVGCDSVLDLDGVSLGKPADAADATQRWTSMRGRTGTLVTGHCVIELPSGREVSDVAETVVHFADLDDAEVEAYVATGEPLHVAGAFTLDGLGGAFVTRIDGDPHNVVGVSLPLMRDLVRRLGHSWTELWTLLDRQTEAPGDEHPLHL